MKTEVRMLLSLIRSAAAIRRDEIPATRLPEEWKSTLTAKQLCIGAEEPPKPTPVQKAWEGYMEVRRKVQETKQRQEREETSGRLRGG